MKLEFIFLSMVIPDPYNPGTNIDIFVKSLIDELNQLWLVEALLYNVFKSVKKIKFSNEDGFDMNYK